MIRIPYGRTTMEARVPETNLLGVYNSRLPESSGNEAELVREALDHPIDSPPLEELAKGKRSAVVITSDHTRPVPSRIIMPQILERLRRENLRLKRQLEEKDMVVELLKKVKEFEGM